MAPPTTTSISCKTALDTETGPCGAADSDWHSLAEQSPAAQRQRRDRSLFEWWRDIDLAIIRDLPALNSATVADPTRISELVQRFSAFLGAPEFLDLIDAEIAPRMAREIIGVAAFPCASIDAHLQRQGSPAGTGYQVFPRLVPLLVRLSQKALHPPTHSHLTYWAYNDRSQPRSFTGSAGEIHFNHAVNLTDRMKALVCDNIRPIAAGEIELDDPQAATRVENAVAAYEDIHRVFVDYKRPASAGCPIRMQQNEFMTGMRPYLIETKIDGVRYTGPNAANIVSWIESDFLIGYRAPFYNDLLRARYPTMMPEEPPLVESFMAGSSMPEVIARHLGLGADDLVSGELPALVGQCRQLSKSAQGAIKEFAKLATAARTTSMVHFSYIKFYVEVAATLLTDAEKQIAIVREGKGVSGTTIEEGAARIAAMRKGHPVVSKLIDVGKAI